MITPNTGSSPTVSLSATNSTTNTTTTTTTNHSPIKPNPSPNKKIMMKPTTTTPPPPPSPCLISQFPTTSSSLGSSPLNTNSLVHSSSPFNKPPLQQQPPIPHHQPFFPFHIPPMHPFPGNPIMTNTSSSSYSTVNSLIPPNPMMMGIYPPSSSSFMMSPPGMPNQHVPMNMMVGHHPSPLHHNPFTSPMMTSLPQGIPITTSSGTPQETAPTMSNSNTTTSPPHVTSSTPQATTTKKTKSSSSSRKKKKTASSTEKKPSPPKRKIPHTSQSIHTHIISYLFEIGLSDSAKTLENDLNNPQLLNVTNTSMKGFVNKLTSELEKLSVSSPPPKKNVTSVNATNAIVKNETYSAISDTAQPSSTNRPLSAATQSIAQSSPITRHITNNNEFNDISLKVHDNPVANNSTSSNQLPTQNYEASQFLAILQQSITKPQGNTHHHDGVATYVDERLNNLEQALSIRESKGEVFSRLRQVEERVLKIEESQNMGVASQKQEASNDSANENAREATMPPMNETPYNSDEFFFNDELDNFCFTMDVDPPLRSGDSHDHHHHEEDDFSLFE